MIPAALPGSADYISDEVLLDSGAVILFQSVLTRGGRQFDLSLSLEKWEDPRTVAGYLHLYADMLVAKKVTVNNIESLDQ